MIQLGFNKDEDLVIASRIQPFTDVSASTNDDFDDSERVSSHQNILCSKHEKNRGIKVIFSFFLCNFIHFLVVKFMNFKWVVFNLINFDVDWVCKFKDLVENRGLD